MTRTHIVIALVLTPLLVGGFSIQEPAVAQSTQATPHLSAQPTQDPASTSSPGAEPTQPLGEGEAVPNDWRAQVLSFQHALVRLPIAAGLAAILAFRPRRRGTPERQSPVIQTQIILAIVGAIVMLVVGASLARAFGIVGAAGLIRYRAKIEDPKDAGVMLSTLGIGLASGVGLYLLAAFATAFVLAVLWVVESIEPQPHALFDLAIKTKEPSNIKTPIEGVLRRFRIPFDLRTTSAEEIRYEVKMPLNRKTDSISAAIVALDPDQSIEVAWERKKEKYVA